MNKIYFKWRHYNSYATVYQGKEGNGSDVKQVFCNHQNINGI